MYYYGDEGAYTDGHRADLHDTDKDMPCVMCDGNGFVCGPDLPGQEGPNLIACPLCDGDGYQPLVMLEGAGE